MLTFYRQKSNGVNMNYFDEYIKATSELIKINSVESAPIDNKPFGVGVDDCLRKALSIAEELGFKTFYGNGYYGYAEIGEGEEMLGILGHLDTVPIGNDWDIPALGGDIIGEYLCGRGVLDDKGPILATLFATKELVDNGFVPNKRIRIIFGCDEESGWECINKYCECEEIPTIAFTPDGDFPVINCEKGVAYFNVHMKKPSYLFDIQGGERANMVMDKVTCTISNDFASILPKDNEYGVIIEGNTLTAIGKSAHGSSPHLGDNALWKIVKFLGGYDSNAKNIANIICNTDGSNYGIQCEDEISGKLTINVGTITSDSEGITFSLDIRHPLCITREQLFEKLTHTFANGTVEYGFFHNPLYIEPTHPLCTSLLKAYESVTGEKLQPITIGGGTYARALPVAVAFGPIFPNQESTIHQKNERAKISDLQKMYNIYLKAIEELAK